MLLQTVRSVFHQKVGGEPLMIRSPGRVNLIGEHTDYNEGFVLPAAIDKEIIFAIAPRGDERCRFYAVDFNQHHETALDSVEKSEKGWPNYLLGVVAELQKAGAALRGFDVVFGGDIPIAAGLSSSAAIEAGLAFALNEMFHLHIETLTLVKLAQQAENQFVGVRCGIMDQFINLFGKKNTVVKLDCRSLEYEYVPFARSDIRIVLCDTRIKRELAFSEYNVRRQQCEEGVRLLQKHENGIRSLRDVDLAFLERHRGELNPVVYRRCEFVVRENVRVLAGCDDLRRGDFKTFGKRMYESHQGLRNEYEVSSPELDSLVDIASRTEGVLGARMMGAGFGGCTINLVEASRLQEFSIAVQQQYQQRLGKEVGIHVSKIVSGTSKLSAEEVLV